MKEYGLSNIIVHAPYIINIANTTKPEVFNLGVDFYKTKLNARKQLAQKILFFILVSHVGAGADVGIKNY